jgi:hypothetical protein
MLYPADGGKIQVYQQKCTCKITQIIADCAVPVTIVHHDTFTLTLHKTQVGTQFGLTIDEDFSMTIEKTPAKFPTVSLSLEDGLSVKFLSNGSLSFSHFWPVRNRLRTHVKAVEVSRTIDTKVCAGV